MAVWRRGGSAERHGRAHLHPYCAGLDPSIATVAGAGAATAPFSSSAGGSKRCLPSLPACRSILRQRSLPEARRRGEGFGCEVQCLRLVRGCSLAAASPAYSIFLLMSRSALPTPHIWRRRIGQQKADFASVRTYFSAFQGRCSKSHQHCQLSRRVESPLSQSHIHQSDLVMLWRDLIHLGPERVVG